jgi:hypothetical protein
MQIKWRKWNRVIHRDLGYLFFATTIIYAVSGIAINHLHDWNPNYIISVREFQTDAPLDRNTLDKNTVTELLRLVGEEDHYKKHFFSGRDQLKVFIDGGNVIINLESGSGVVEKIKRRPLIKAFNDLHYNPGKWWTWFSDIYAISLFLIAVSGLFVLKGSKGITARGSWLTIIGILLPIVLFYQTGNSIFAGIPVALLITGFFVLYLLSLILSESVGKNSRLGVEWSFFISMLFTPVLGFIVMYIIDRMKR